MQVMLSAEVHKNLKQKEVLLNTEMKVKMRVQEMCIKVKTEGS